MNYDIDKKSFYLLLEKAVSVKGNGWVSAWSEDNPEESFMTPFTNEELQNIIERAIIFAEGSVIQVADIGLVNASGDSEEQEDETLQEALRRFEKSYIYRILKKCKGDKTAAAKILDMGVSTLYRKISELEMDVDPETLGA